jgi:hypothetical protein
MIGKFLEEIVGLVPELFKKEEAWLIIFILMMGGFVSFSLFQFNLSPWDIPLILWNFLKATWWFWLFFPLFWLFQSILLFWRQEEYKAELEFTMLEIKIPREIQRGAKSMEQILLILHSLRNVPSIAKAKWYEGETTTTFSFEIVTMGGEIHFFIRCLQKQKAIVESSFFSYYPDVEIIEVEDYMRRFPQTPKELYKSGLSAWGTEVILAREDMIPIKTYEQFEGAAEEKRVDPISALFEVLGKAKRNETFCIQILATPADPKWGEDWKDDLEKLRAEVKGSPADAEGGKGVSPQPHKADTLKAIETNITKPAFELLIRLLYIAPVDEFSAGFLQSGTMSAFNQYGALNLNAFRKNSGVGVDTSIWSPPYVYTATRLEYRRQRMYWNYLHRETPQEIWMGKFLTSHLYNLNFKSKTFLLNVEGLATIFHLPPAIVLTTPHIQRIESRKAGPTVGLSIFGEDADIERFY